MYKFIVCEKSRLGRFVDRRDDRLDILSQRQS